MTSRRLIPALWVRLIVLIAFGIFVLTQDMPWLAALAVVLGLLTIGQLVAAYRQR